VIAVDSAKTAWIVGASSGIGLETARALASGGWRIGLGSRREDLLAEIVGSLPGKGHGSCRLDVREAISVREWAATLRSLVGEPHLLLYSAGWGVFRKIEETTEEEWDSTIDVNLKGLFLVTREVLPGMITRGEGHFVSVLSVAARTAFPKNGAYAASKFGALGFTEVLRAETRRHGIRVTSVIPGATDTPFWDHLGGDWDRTKMMPASQVARAIREAVDAPLGSMIEEIRIGPQLGNL
jgi:NAD(P)-dependent dehydrogenase (short-subunit alcohol dehydrogenase family)